MWRQFSFIFIAVLPGSHALKSIARLPAVMGLACLLAACAVKFVPDYDEHLFTQLNEQNQAALVLFSSVSAGSSRADYRKFKASYDKVIGGMEAVRSVIEARTIPVSGVKLTKLLVDLCKTEASMADCVNSSSRNIRQVLDTLNTMRDQHRQRGLDAGGVPLFKNDYEMAMHRILVVEAALKR